MLQGSRATTTKGSFQTRCQIHALGQLQSFTYVCYQVTNSKPLQLVTSGVRLIPKAFATQMPEAPAGISALLDRIRKAP
jgi:hypothetical protein